MSTAIPSPRPVTLEVRRFHPDTLRELELHRLRKTRGYLTGAEALEYTEVTRRNDCRAFAFEADLANDTRTESHAFPANPNPHDD